METPSSTKRITRFQKEGTLKSQPRSISRGNGDRSALLDITNDSPIVGLAAGILKTPLSASAGGRTPGSGEAILRCQVKTLLQKVDEEEMEVVKDSLLGIFDHLRSPASLLAPTPANTPQIGSLPVGKDAESELPVAASDSSKEVETLDLSVCVINRALLFYSPEESDSSFPLSELTSEGSVCRETPSEDDSSSVWSLQVHDGSSQKNDDESEWVEEDDDDEEDDDVDDDHNDDNDDDDVLIDLCEGIRTMSMGKSELPEFAGKHVRFNYDSDGEIAGEEVAKVAVSPSVLRLKGLPAPEGKHLRFQDEEEVDD